MRCISLYEASVEIMDACHNAQHSPFFYIVGAGISTPTIPTSGKMIELFKGKLDNEGRQVTPSAGSAMDEYSFWFREAYRQPAERPGFLRSLMENKPLSQANWRLAHLLSDGRIGNVVVTPNFDEMLSRALTILGLSHILCDHPATASRIDVESPEIQLLHVHGTYRFYDCCNLSGEIIDRAAPSPMTSQLDSLLLRRSPLVIGYSGWESDIIMQALRRRLQNQRLPRHIYWFCFNHAAIDVLPSWLRDHTDVCFVVPEETPNSNDEVGQPALPVAEMSLSPKRPNCECLTAQFVFDSLLQINEVPAPHLTRDPLQFFATHLRELLLEEGSQDESEDDPYFIMDVVDRIQRAKDREDENTAQFEKQISIVLDNLRSSKYEEAIAEINAIELTNISFQEIEKLSQILQSATQGAVDAPETELRFHHCMESVMKEWLRRNDCCVQNENKITVESQNIDIEVRT